MRVVSKGRSEIRPLNCGSDQYSQCWPMSSRPSLADSHPRDSEPLQVRPVGPDERLVHGHPQAAGFALVFGPVGLNGFAEALDFLLARIGRTRIEMFRPLAPLSWKIKDSRF